MSSELISSRIEDYVEQFVPDRPLEMVKMEEDARKKGFPIIGPSCGYLCYQVARMTRARHICELGSGFGYSTAWFAKAVKENGGGTVHHIVWDGDLSKKARAHLTALGYDDIVEYHIGEAIAILRGMKGPFDLIFNDIDKHAYPDAFPVINEKLRSAGILIVDNMLWGGDVFDKNSNSPDTNGVREFTRNIIRDANWIASLIPIRDGLVLAYKKSDL